MRVFPNVRIVLFLIYVYYAERGNCSVVGSVVDEDMEEIVRFFPLSNMRIFVCSLFRIYQDIEERAMDRLAQIIPAS